MKYCIIRRAAYRIPGTKRIVWANVISENDGMALLLIPKTHVQGFHSIVFGRQNSLEAIFDAVEGSPTLEIRTSGVKSLGNTLQALGDELWREELKHLLESDEPSNPYL